MQRIIVSFLLAFFLLACGNASKQSVQTIPPEAEAAGKEEYKSGFNADSAWSYVKKQVDFGPRVPNSASHSACGDWLAAELKRHGADVLEQRADLRAFDGTVLKARNIFGRFNPQAEERILLLAHWDCRPWADEDSDPAKRHLPVDGANDGASGVGVLLEVARQLGGGASGKGIDMLFVDAEDWGTPSDDDSWAMGARYFAEHLPVAGYSPNGAILLDMVGGKDAVFCREYFSEQSAPGLASKIWAIASGLGYGDIFLNKMGGAVNDDHIHLIDNGIPAIDIIEYRPGEGFNPSWHTSMDNMDGISKETLKAVGDVVTAFVLNEE